MPTQPQVHARKSTIVRSVMLRSLRFTLRFVGRWAPHLTAALAERVFLTAPRRPAPPWEVSRLTEAEAFTVDVDGREVKAWSWGQGPPVLLVHGWGGRGAQLAELAPVITGLGMRAVTFDAPGHGASAGRTSSLIEMADAILALGEEVGPFYAVVAHSAGAAATTVALDSGLRAEKVVQLAPAIDLGAFAQIFASMLGLSDEVVTLMRRRIEERFAVSWDELKSLAIAPTMNRPLLVIHDRDDHEIPWQVGRELAAAWPGARFETTTTLGHYRILRSPVVALQVLEFLRHAPAELVASPPASPAAGRVFETAALGA